ncbi:hypothetical protein CL176_05635 [Suicoccus acidiformans]|uniref:Rpn family recombination-promoting nuclease/putative transposase n=1 Tax=Suicoccus acidiformans TaxID=2036206 RepID=A0A347WKA8_9LACT|nr:hypothetical protein [Suicoccus acidiformans]AXY25515.1 hypothetical protein CL176_05635 [Suicoccus acidiformans]
MIYMDLTNRNIKESHSAYHWWRYFNGLEPLEIAPEYIFQAIDVVNAANLNQEEIEMITQAEYKKANAEAYAQDVYEQGADQERVKTIKSMLKLNYNLEDIAKVFDMTVEEVQYLAKR